MSRGKLFKNVRIDQMKGANGVNRRTIFNFSTADRHAMQP